MGASGEQREQRQGEARSSADDNDEDEDVEASRENAVIAASYLVVVRAVAEMAPGSVWAHPGWGVGLLAWGARVVREEGVVLPGEEGGGGEDEFGVFVGEW